MSTIVLSNDWAKYSSTDFWAINNVTNKGSLKNGINFTQTITVDTETFPSNTTLSWSWPNTFNPMTFAYPEVILGYKPWDNYGSLNFTSQINELREFKIDYNLTMGGQTDNYNVAFTLWLTDRAQGQREDIKTEVMVWVHDGAMNPAGSPVGMYDGKTLDATVFVNPVHGDTSGVNGNTWQYIALEASTDVLAGQIDIRHILFDLKQKGLLTGTEYVSGYELGAEVAGGTGSLQINSLGQTFSRYLITAGADNLVGTVDDDFISALAGNDLLTGSAGNDSLDGGEGDDRLDGGTGSDSMRGGAGNDVYVVDNAGDIVNESLTGSTGVDTVQSSISFSLVNTSRLLGAVENLALLGTGNISGTGNALNNLITGNAGANVLNGSSGADNMRGLAGNDIYIVDNAGDIVNESLAGSTGIDTVQSSISFSLSNATRVIGAVENLTLLGSAAIGGTGNALANTIVGNAAANVVNGAAGNDRIIGGGGNDTLLGSTGIDTVTGDLGNDIFRFVETPTAANRDIITDFANVAGNNDTFQLENAVFTTLGAGAAHPLNSAFFWSNTTGLAHDANDHVIYNRSTGALYYDSNGTAAGGSVQIATLTNRTALTAADFTVI